MTDFGQGQPLDDVDPAANTGISKWTLTGTARERTNLEVRGCDFYTLRDGKVICKGSHWKIVG